MSRTGQLVEGERSVQQPSALLRAAIRDLVQGAERWELWSMLGWHEIRQRYRRSTIGPFWITLSMGLTIAGLAYLYAGLFGQNVQEYLPYVAVGIIVFNFLSGLVTDGSSIFINSGRVILQLKAPLSLYIYQVIWKNILIFLHNLLIYAMIVVFVRVPIGWNVLLSLVGFVLIVTNALWICVILGGLSARFRDVPPIVSSVMQVAFFLTPVFWTPGSLPSREVFVHLNPFYYLIDIVRMPLLGQTPPWSMWLVLAGMNLASAVVAIVFFARYRARIAYWV